MRKMKFSFKFSENFLQLHQNFCLREKFVGFPSDSSNNADKLDEEAQQGMKMKINAKGLNRKGKISISMCLPPPSMIFLLLFIAGRLKE